MRVCNRLDRGETAGRIIEQRLVAVKGVTLDFISIPCDYYILWGFIRRHGSCVMMRTPFRDVNTAIIRCVARYTTALQMVDVED